MDEPQRITVDELQERLDTGEPVFFIDTRSPDAWRAADSQIAGSRRIPPDDVADRLDEIPGDRLIVTYCT